MAGCLLVAVRELEQRGLRPRTPIDCHAHRQRTSARESHRYIHRRKTGALIEAACALGALAAGGDEAMVATLTAYGREIGVAFQIADDLLDATATSEELGKTAGRDATLEKATYVSVLGQEGARQEALRHAQAAGSALREGGVTNGTLLTLAGYIVQRRS